MRPVPLQELRTRVASLRTAALLAAGALGLAACASSAPATGSSQPVPSTSEVVPFAAALRTVPSPDPRVGLRAGLFDAEEAIWNLRTQPISSAGRPSSISLLTMRGCQEGRPLKSRMRAQTFSIGASMTEETVIVGMARPCDDPGQDSLTTRDASAYRSV